MILALLLGWAGHVPEGSGPIADLVDRLTRSWTGSYEITARFERRQLAPEVHARALEYAFRLGHDCFMAETPEGRRWIEIQSLGAASTPVLLGDARQPAQHVESVETLHVLGSQSRLVREQVDAGRVSTQVWMRDLDDILWTAATDGRRQPWIRSRPVDTFDGLMGTQLALARSFEQLRFLIDLAAARGIAPVIGEGSAVLDLDVRDVRLRERILRGAWCGRGVLERPGRVALHVQRDASGGLDCLVEWTDCEGVPSMRHRSIWIADQTVPRSIATLLFAPGSDAVVEESEAVIHEIAGAPDHAAVAWRPDPGDTVLDHRFGRVVRYQVEADGRIPSEEELRLEAERARFEPASEPVMLVAGSSEEPSGSGPSVWLRPVAWGAALLISLFLAVRRARPRTASAVEHA